jgi:hypothetical protein
MSRSLLIDGIKWLIHDERDPAYPGGEPVLICYGPGIARRIRHFPAKWRELTDGELIQICKGC